MTLEHPAITRTLRTGYPEPVEELVCSCCGDTILPGEWYGENEDDVVCPDCMRTEWDSLTDEEQFDIMGYIPRKII